MSLIRWYIGWLVRVDVQAQRFFEWSYWLDYPWWETDVQRLAMEGE